MIRIVSFFRLISENRLYLIGISFLFMAIFSFGQCQSAQERALEMVKENQAKAKANALSYKSNACPNYGNLKPAEIKQATYQEINGMERVMLLIQGDLKGGEMGGRWEDRYTSRSLSVVSSALKIGSRKDLDEFIRDYRDVCPNGQIPYWDEIKYNIEVEKIKVAMASSQKIKPSEILDLRKGTLFIPSWYNSKENPSIHNFDYYGGNEFAYQDDKEKFEKIRQYKYVLTDDYMIFEEYDFLKKSYRIVTDDQRIQYTQNRPIYQVATDLRFPFSINFQISVEKAEKFKKQYSSGLDVIMLSKISPKIHIDPEAHYYLAGKDKAAEIKYFTVQTLNYHILFDGELYKNY